VRAFDNGCRGTKRIKEECAPARKPTTHKERGTKPMAIQYRCDHCGAVASSESLGKPATWHQFTVRYTPPTGHDLESLVRGLPRHFEVHADTEACLQALIDRIVTLIRQTVAAGGGPPTPTDDE
jgi:hypothetical protein